MSFFHSNILTPILRTTGKYLLGSLPVVLFLIGQVAVAQSVKVQVATKNIEKTVPYKTGDVLLIEGEKAEVEVLTADRDEITVKMQLISKHPDKSVAAADLELMQYEIDRKGNEIVIRNFIEKNENGEKPASSLKAQYVIYVPEQCPVSLSNYFGSTMVENLQNGLDVNSEFCSIGLQNIKGEIGIKTRFGDVEGEEIEGNVNIEARRSNITLSRLGGKFNIKAQYGVIKVFADQSLIDMNIIAEKSDVYFHDSSLDYYNYALTARNGKIKTPGRMPFDYLENSNEFKKAIYKPSSEMAGVRVAINVSFGEIRIGE